MKLPASDSSITYSRSRSIMLLRPSASTDDIACWSIDTDYTGESFFARHACFTGAEEPCDKLKRDAPDEN
ncbi:MAG: hypothetical protein ACYC9O_07680 [Candidatus Latescibacterota bacterium]